MEKSALNKFQHQYWVTKQTVYRKLGKKEDDCIVSSDASLDAKLELFKSITQTSSAMNKLLDRYQERICYLAQEQNTMGRFLKEYGKSDKSAAGKMMIQMGKSLIYCSQQEIGLRPPLLRLYQEVETFRHRAVEDTLETIKHMERLRTEYRASLNWMKNVSQELDPDTCKQMEKFRKVQNHVKKSKAQFDKLKLACLQKVDLLAAARCNMFSHALIQYQNATMKTTEKNSRIFFTLAKTFTGYQHFEFCVVKELVEPAQKLAKESGAPEPSDELLFDFANEEGGDGDGSGKERTPEVQELLAIGGGGDGGGATNGVGVSNLLDSVSNEGKRYSAQDLLSSELLLENLLGPLDLSPETETASEALDLSLAWPESSSKENGHSAKSGGRKDKDKERSAAELLSDEFDNIPFEGDTDTMTLLHELLSASGPMLMPQQAPPKSASDDSGSGSDSIGSENPGLNSCLLQPTTSSSGGTSSGGFLPSQLLDFGSLDPTHGDLLNFNAPAVPQLKKGGKEEAKASTGATNWYDIFADLDPISNPDTVGKKEEETESRYC